MLKGLSITALLAFALAFTTHSPGLMGLTLAIGLGCGVSAALVFIDRHVRASSRSEYMSPREIEALRNAFRHQVGMVRQLPPAQSH